MSLLLGLALALTLPPLPTGWLTPLAVGAVLAYAARAPSPRQVAGRVWWSVTAMSALHLWWLSAFLSELFGFPPAGALALALFALEGGFFALMAYLVARTLRRPQARLWGLAGGWLVVEFLRFLGPLAFPWPTLGAALLGTPVIQTADLWGVLGVSGLVLGLGAALAAAWEARFSRAPRTAGPEVGPGTGMEADGDRAGAVQAPTFPALAPLLGFGLLWAFALGYGLTRVPGSGPEQAMRVLRTDFDSFGRATGTVSPEAQLAEQLRVSTVRPAGSVVVWSETALRTVGAVPLRLSPGTFPGPGLTGLGVERVPAAPNQNLTVAVDAAGQVTGQSLKAKLVPFGEYFPLYAQAPALYRPIERLLGFRLDAYETARRVTPLPLGGALYGAYVCYDSVFPGIARALVARGAQVLVNPSNDGWYQGWGVAQHFWMGRVRAIETRRWLVRSVNRGVAGAVDDLGRPVQTVSEGPGLKVLDVRPRLLNAQTWYVRLGDLPALLMAALLLGWGFFLDRSRR